MKSIFFVLALAMAGCASAKKVLVRDCMPVGPEYQVCSRVHDL